MESFKKHKIVEGNTAEIFEVEPDRTLLQGNGTLVKNGNYVTH